MLRPCQKKTSPYLFRFVCPIKPDDDRNSETCLNNKILYFTIRKLCFYFLLPIMRKGAARFIPMKSTPAYIQKPKAQSVAIAALTLPRSPSHGFDLTQSNIIQVTERERICFNIVSFHLDQQFSDLSYLSRKWP